jgi:hypothetical protein
VVTKEKFQPSCPAKGRDASLPILGSPPIVLFLCKANVVEFLAIRSRIIHAPKVRPGQFAKPIDLFYFSKIPIYRNGE